MAWERERNYFIGTSCQVQVLGSAPAKTDLATTNPLFGSSSASFNYMDSDSCWLVVGFLQQSPTPLDFVHDGVLRRISFSGFRYATMFPPVALTRNGVNTVCSFVNSRSSRSTRQH